MGAYVAAPGPPLPGTPAAAVSPQGAAPAASPGNEAFQAPPAQNGHGPAVTNNALTMNSYAITTVEDDKPKNGIEAAMRRLVNVDRIDEPAEAELKLTMLQKEEAKKAPKGKSKGLPPVAAGMVGTQATLSQIQEIKPVSTKMCKPDSFEITFPSITIMFIIEQERAQAADPVMKAPPPNAYHSGAIVVHGQGPPPLQQARGFGIGASLPNGGFGQQQHQAPMGYHGQQPHGYHQPYPGQPQYR